MSANLKYEETEIDGIKFATQQYAAMRSFELMGKLASTIGPALGALSMADEGTDLEKLAPVLAVALRDVDPTKLGALVIDVLTGTTATITEDHKVTRVDLNSVKNIDRVFSGRLMTMFKVLVHALKVNYSDFGFGSANESAPKTETE